MIQVSQVTRVYRIDADIITPEIVWCVKNGSIDDMTRVCHRSGDAAEAVVVEAVEIVMTAEILLHV